MAKLVKGDKFPNFTVNTAFENGLTIEKIVDGKPTMFMVLRYIGCTVCRYDVHMLTERYNEFAEKGVNVVVVMQSKPEIVQRDLAGGTLPFHLICDSKQELYTTLELNSMKDKSEAAPTEEAQARLAAKRAGITTILIPEDNRKDVEEIKAEYVAGLTFHYVKRIEEVLALALK